MASSDGGSASGNILVLATFLIGLYILFVELAVVQGLLMTGGAFLISAHVRAHLVSVRPAVPYAMIGLSLVLAALRSV